MRAQVVGIESATCFVDGEERVWIRFADADNGFARVRFRRGVIDTTHTLKIDDEISVEIVDTHTLGKEIREKGLQSIKNAAEKAKSLA